MSDIIYLYQNIHILLVVFIRVLSAIIFLPIIEETKLPKIALAGFSLAISICVIFRIDSITIPETLTSYTVLIIKEIIIGLTLGFVVKMFFQIYPLIGSVLSTQGGLGMSLMMDPTSGSESALLGRFYNLGFMAFFLVSGGYHWFIQVLVDSFQMIPIGESVFRVSVSETVIHTLSVYFLMGFKIALPIVAILFITDVAMGILARTVPQMNMFVIGIPLKMIIMFVMMIVSMPLVVKYNAMIIEQMVQTVLEVLQEMRPI